MTLLLEDLRKAAKSNPRGLALEELRSLLIQAYNSSSDDGLVSRDYADLILGKEASQKIPEAWGG